MCAACRRRADGLALCEDGVSRQVASAGLVSQTPRSPQQSGPARICPCCGAIFPAADARQGPVELCAQDGYALVSIQEHEQAQGDPILGRTVAGRFTVVGRLGNGSMGAVYRAWQQTVGRWVALKIMRYDRTADAEARTRFEREARAMSQLVSPHTVTVFDFGHAEDGSVFLAMELLEGESVGRRLATRGRMPYPEAVKVVREALVSLGEAHSKGIIHRDLKPDNLFLARIPDAKGEPRQVCKLLDFGIAKVVRDQNSIDALETQAGTVFGTPRYMSPEQAQGKPLDARSDLYSLGVILYQLVTGRPPFEDEEAVVVMARHIRSKPRPPSQVVPELYIPPALERVILRALAKDPGDRPDSAETFIRALEAAERTFPDSPPGDPPAVESGEVTLVYDDPLPTLAPSAVRRRRLLLTIGLGVGALALVGTAVALGVKLGARASSTAAPAASYATSTSSQPVISASPAALSAPKPGHDTVVSVESLPVVRDSSKAGSRRSVAADKSAPAASATASGTRRYERFE